MARKRSVSVRDYKAIVRSFHRESDRSAAILASSFLECYLGDHLRAFLVADKVVDNFLDNSMESLYARSILAYAIGLISKEMLDDIDVVRLIRNIFAHQPENCNFDSKEIREKCSKLSTAKPIPVEGGGEYVQDDPKLQFLLAVSRLVGTMHNSKLGPKRRQVGKQ